MVIRRHCAFRLPTGEMCRAAPLKESQFCWVHDPEHAQEVKESQRLGGLRRRKEATLSAAYDFEGLTTMDGIIRLLQLVAMDTLGMENSVSRNRTLIYLAMVALKAREVGVQEERITALEQAVQGQRIVSKPPVFDIEPNLLEDGDKEAK